MCMPQAKLREVTARRAVLEEKVAEIKERQQLMERLEEAGIPPDVDQNVSGHIH